MMLQFIISYDSILVQTFSLCINLQEVFDWVQRVVELTILHVALYIHLYKYLHIYI